MSLAKKKHKSDVDFSGTVTINDVQVSQELVSQAEAEAGTETEVRAFSPLRVAQAIAALAPSPEAATTEAAGIVELATTVEAQAGTDTERAVTPSGLPFTIVNNGIGSKNMSEEPLGTDAIAIGNYAGAVEDYGISLGSSAYAESESSIAIGASSGASGINAVAIGPGVNSDIDNAFKIGVSNSNSIHFTHWSPVVAAAAPSTHKLQLDIGGSTYFVLLSDS